MCRLLLIWATSESTPDSRIVARHCMSLCVCACVRVDACVRGISVLKHLGVVILFIWPSWLLGTLLTFATHTLTTLKSLSALTLTAFLIPLPRVASIRRRAGGCSAER